MEYVNHRGLFLRIAPSIFNNDSKYNSIITVFEQENFERNDLNERTLFIDLTQSLEQIRGAMHVKWRKSLIKAEQNN